jgi:hypothetical protein
MTELADVILRTSAEHRAREEHNARMQRDYDPTNIEKEVQLKGATLDFQNNEQTFLNTMQEFEQGTRKLLSETKRTGAEMGQTAATAAQERQPEELTLLREQLTSQIGETAQRQTANLWSVLKAGDQKTALRMLNSSKLLAAGETDFTGFKIEDQAGPDGKPVKTLVLENKDPAKSSRLPIKTLEALHQRYGAQYKEVGGNLVRIGADGKATPVYTAPETHVNQETGEYYNRRSPPPASFGTGLRPQKPTMKQEKHADDRVKQGTDVVNKYFGIDSFSGLKTENQPKYIGIVNSMGAKIRGGADPETAANAAIAEAERAGKITSQRGKGLTYSGPTPWRQ